MYASHGSVAATLGVFVSTLAVAASTTLGAASVARADRILVFQQFNADPAGADRAGPAAVPVLQGLGHEVTAATSLVPVLPADLSVFDTIWVIQVLPLTGPQENAIVDFVNAGGGLYFSGERLCCESLNASIQNTLNRLIRASTRIGNSGEGGDIFDAALDDPHQITSMPNAVPQWLAGQAGLMSMIDGPNQVYRNALGVGAAAWAGEDLDRGGGCIYVPMDLSFWFPEQHPEQDKAALAENIERFLSTCDDADSDGATDPAERAAGTMLADPDSDDDGLCDGFATVPGVCVPGESVLDDHDMDGLLDPLDDDDDGDGIPTSIEVVGDALGEDGDSIPAWLDIDSDGNSILDRDEGTVDHDGDGVPGFVDLGDDPQQCGADADCTDFAGESVCDLDREYCVSRSSPMDAGVAADGGGGTRDGGVAGMDAGRADASTAVPPADGGCGCRAAEPAPGRFSALLSAMVLASIAARARRRRLAATAARPRLR